MEGLFLFALLILYQITEISHPSTSVQPHMIAKPTLKNKAANTILGLAKHQLMNPCYCLTMK